MRRRSKHHDDQAEVNMTPMLDIVFILLIFFIVTATFLSEEGLDMRPPPDSDTPPDDTAPPPIVVQVDDDNNIFVNRTRTDVDRVLSAVNRFRAEEPNSAVLLEVQDEADHGIIVQIWDEMGAKFAGLRKKDHAGEYIKRINGNRDALLRKVQGDLQSAIETACENPGMGRIVLSFPKEGQNKSPPPGRRGALTSKAGKSLGLTRDRRSRNRRGSGTGLDAWRRRRHGLRRRRRRWRRRSKSWPR